MRGREYLVAIKAENGLLALHTLHRSDEIRDPHAEILDLPERVKPGASELKTDRRTALPNRQIREGGYQSPEPMGVRRHSAWWDPYAKATVFSWT
ncbi:hypothetical protein AB0469_39805 [Streptomyces sp. NPDC093801]|uniref:hypothetical protein n=1 Tax=Streptomyces sp. NPDC093801 TaxID=3155203 RepID=UPI00344E4A7C